MATAPKEAENAIGLEEIHTEGKEPPKGQKTFTVEEAVETIGFGRFHIMLFLIMGSTGMVFFGYMVFSIVLGLLADRYGRWKILLLSFLWAAYFSLLTSFAPSYIWFVFLRAMVGGGVSGHAQGLIIKTEFLPTKYRGYMLPLSQVFWLAGSLLIIGLASVVNPTVGWRWLIRIASIPGILLILVFKFIPESARYNMTTGNTAVALATLQRIARMNGVAMPEGQLREPAKERRGRFKDLIHPKYLRTTLQIWIIWLGIAFTYYGVILASAELLERDLVCGSVAPPLQDSGDDSEESHSPCHCHFFGPAAYQTMIISTVGEIARNLFPHPCPAIPLSQCSRQRFELCMHLVTCQGPTRTWHCWQLLGYRPGACGSWLSRALNGATFRLLCLAGLWPERAKPPRPVLLTQQCLACMAQDRHWCPASAQPISRSTGFII
ncbi:putative transporter SVOPL isoform X2 [Corvus moneduloides]|uniref:putative transporter SVOPL isoform X2 n=1 Tax=Corvus moneduloides TaxID=1196302 RepID=UPI00136399B4|nr:putative transporter SVOPL isoform X2 [Corvus moneduloides]